MTEIFSSQALTALFRVVMIDLVLAGDNAIVIGLAAAGLPKDQRSKAILAGIAVATILRIGFGGILLLWVCWKMWRELRTSPEHHQKNAEVASDDGSLNAGSNTCERPRKTLGEAIWLITIADVSMSLDNVLAVAGAARETPLILIFGLGLSIALMGFAASFIANLLQKHRWIAYVGLAIILYVAFDMCYRGAEEVWPHALAFVTPHLASFL